LFSVAVFDEDGVSLATTSDGGTGVKTISQIMDTIRTDLLALLGGGWTITNNGTNKTMDIQNASKFSLTAPLTLVPSYFEPPPNNDTAHFLKIAQVQPYIPSMSGTTGEDQVIELTITNANLFPGATYTVTFRGQDGQEHTVNYVSLDHDGVPDVLAGILAAMTAEGATDDFFLSVFSSTDGITAQFRTHNAVSMDATVTRAGSPYWELVPFPKALFNPVVRGASADLMGEWGQTDKQTTGEGKVPMPPEEDNVSADFQTTTTAALTTQQKAHSRYKY
jgi:hypothetical protein